MAADDPRASIPGAPFLTTEELRRDVSALREILQARLDGMDRAAVVLSETVNRTPTEIQTQIAHLKELHDERFRSTEQVSATRLSGIEQQFAERDVRTEQSAIATDSALKAALQAAKEAVFEQAQAAAKAAEKTELSTTKQIDLIQNQIKTLGDMFGDKIDDLKGRIDRGEGTSAGTREAITENRADETFAQAADIARAERARQNISITIAALSSLIAIAAVIIVAFTHK